MSELPLTCVVDASVGVKLLVPEEYSEEAQSLFERSLLDPAESLYVPDLFFVECANVLWKKVRWDGYPQDMARQNLADLKSLSLPSVSTDALMERALKIACAHGITAYDACYLALSEQTGALLVTADSHIADQLPDGAFSIVVLGS